MSLILYIGQMLTFSNSHVEGNLEYRMNESVPQALTQYLLSSSGRHKGNLI